MELDWKVEALEKLRLRNRCQSYHFQDVYKANSIYFGENFKMNVLLTDLKAQINSIQFDIAGMISTSNSADMNSFLEKTKFKISQIQKNWKEISTVKKILDQRKLINIQSEELKVAKSELSKSLEKILLLETQLELEKKKNLEKIDEINTLRESLTQYENKLRIIEEENKNLVDRIIGEKNKAAESLNDMNKLVDKDKTL